MMKPPLAWQKNFETIKIKKRKKQAVVFLNLWRREKIVLLFYESLQTQQVLTADHS
jgi:hypothetical protein